MNETPCPICGKANLLECSYCAYCPECGFQVAADSREDFDRQVEAHRKKVFETSLRYSLADVIAILRNLGHDVECGACMAVAFTGAAPGIEHTCGVKS